jgi:iron complex outermembrane receptor protein
LLVASSGNQLTQPEQVYNKLISAPAGYMLWGAEAGCSLPIGHQHIDISLSVTNLTNVAYRDYLNLFRYYVDDLGRNISLRIKIPFGVNNH